MVVVNNDPKELVKLNARFDLILVDAPCSGEGLFRKNPGSVRTWTPQSFELCVSRQKRIFLDIWEALKTGGYLIYSTCTFNPEENENNLADWYKKCAFDSIEIPFPEDWKIHRIKKDRIFGYYFYPHHVKGEGFFISILQKHSQSSTNKNQKNKNLFFSPEKSWKKNPTVDKNLNNRNTTASEKPKPHLYLRSPTCRMFDGFNAANISPLSRNITRRNQKRPFHSGTCFSLILRVIRIDSRH